MRPATSIRTALALAVAALASPAFAQSPQFSCPIRLELLTGIDGGGAGGLDRLIYGVRARDWTPEFLDQAQRRYEACQAAASGPQSLKDAERVDAARQFQLLEGALQQRDRLVAQEVRQVNAQAAVTQSGATQISQSSGTLTWAYTRQSSGKTLLSTTCAEPKKLPQDLLNLPSQSQLELPEFYAACVQAHQIPGSAAFLFKESTEELAQDRQAQSAFITGVRALMAAPQQQMNQSIAVLEEANRFHGSNEPAANTATEQLAALREKVDTKECAVHARQAGLPDDLMKAQYLMEWVAPASLVAMACGAARNGVSYRFNAKGLLSKDSFEVKGPVSVKVVLARQQLPEGGVLLVPLEATVRGNTFEVTRHNLQVLAHQIRVALTKQ